MSESLLIYEDEGKAFQSDEVSRVFEEVAPGTVQLNGISAAECTFESNSGSVIVRLASDLGAIKIEGANEVAAEAVVAIRTALGRDVHLTDMGYNFDLTLDGTQSAGEVLSILNDESQV